MAQNAQRLDDVLSGLADWVIAGDPPSDGRLAADPVSLLRGLPNATDCDLALDIGPAPVAASDLAVIATEAFRNAARFYPGNGRARVFVVGRTTEAGWHLDFTDDGAGPPVSDPAALLEPLARAPVGARLPGAGFGLAVIVRVVARYRGQVTFGRSSKGQGAQLSLFFPG